MSDVNANIVWNCTVCHDENECTLEQAQDEYQICSGCKTKHDIDIKITVEKVK